MKYLTGLFIIIMTVCLWQTVIMMPTADTDKLDVLSIEPEHDTRESIQEQREAQRNQTRVATHAAARQPHVTSQNTSQPIKVETQKDFYQYIIDNNLFRPLGYRPRTPAPQYQLIGTVITPNTAETTAMIVEYRTRKLHTVKTGDTLGKNVQIIKIQDKQVELQEGKKIITLHRRNNIFLNYR